VPCQVKAHGSLANHSADLTIARIAALSGAGSFSQAVTIWDKSCPNATGFCEAICEGESVFAKLALDLSRVRAPPLPPFHVFLFPELFSSVDFIRAEFLFKSSGKLIAQVKLNGAAPK
jgi:hypothetical protein